MERAPQGRHPIYGVLTLSSSIDNSLKPGVQISSVRLGSARSIDDVPLTSNEPGLLTPMPSELGQSRNSLFFNGIDAGQTVIHGLSKPMLPLINDNKSSPPLVLCLDLLEALLKHL